VIPKEEAESGVVRLTIMRRKPDSLPVRPYRQLHHSGWPIKLAYVYFPVLCASSDVTTDSNGSNKSERGLSMIQPRMVMKGMTKRAIWILVVPDSLPVRPYRQLHHSGWPIKLAYVYFPVLCAWQDTAPVSRGDSERGSGKRRGQTHHHEEEALDCRQLHHSGWPIKLAYVYFPVLCASSDERI
jgi:hypothetical protein